jgi:hypothetical protein
VRRHAAAADAWRKRLRAEQASLGPQRTPSLTHSSCYREPVGAAFRQPAQMSVLDLGYLPVLPGVNSGA